MLSSKLLHRNCVEQLESFRKLSFAIRLLSGKTVIGAQIDNAENLIKSFLKISFNVSELTRNRIIFIQCVTYHSKCGKWVLCGVSPLFPLSQRIENS